MSKTPVSAVETSLRILRQLEEDGPSRITDLADRLGKPKATVFYHLKTLEGNGYVVQSDAGYRLGLRILELGGRVRACHPLTAVVEPTLKQLAKEANEMVVFAVGERNSAVVLDVERPTGSPTDITVPVGIHLPIHCSAAGKALLTGMAEAEREAAIDQLDLVAHTPDTITDEAVLREHLVAAGESGFAFDRGEREPDVHGVASPVAAPDGSVAGALGIVGPASRLYSDRFEHELPHLVERYAGRIRHELQS